MSGADKSDKMVLVTVRITKEQHKKLKRYCLEHDITINDLIRDFINKLPEEDNK